MKSRLLVASGAFAALSALTTISAFAAPVTWTLNDVAFGDGGKVSGSFVFDSDSNTYLSWDITSTATINYAANGFQYLTGSSYTTNGYNPHTSNYYGNPGGFIFYATDPTLGFPTSLVLNYSAPLTDAGGVITLKSASESYGFNYRSMAAGPYLNGGTLGSVSSVPEPSSIALAVSGLVALLLVRRRNWAD